MNNAYCFGVGVNSTYCLTVEDVYGRHQPELPSGWELTGEFRPPKVGEMFLSVVKSDGPMECHTADYPNTGPRLIMRKKTTTPTVESEYMGQSMEQLRVKMRNSWWGEGYEWTGEFRPVREGDYFLCASGGNYVLGPDKGACTGSYRVIMKKLPTIEDIYGRDLAQMKYTRVMSVADVYGSIPKVPEGYRVVDFRVAKKGEMIFATTGIAEEALGNPGATPRLILERED